VGVFETAIEGIESGRAESAGLSDQGQLPARLPERADCGGLSRRCLVSFLHPAALERIIQEHLIGGKAVEDYVLAQNANF
jgi:hypothetical protein